MFDFAWSEIALIGVVALIAIGPKDMPVAIKAISDTIKKLRRMAGEFQGHVDEMIRDADLGDVKTSINELRSLNPRSMMQKAIDPDNALRGAFADPFRDHPVRPVSAPLDQINLPNMTGRAMPAPPSHDPAGSVIPPAVAAPAFIPPAYAPQPAAGAEAAPAVVPPAFIPPAASEPG